MTAAEDPERLVNLARVFTPAQAAQVLRDAGLVDMTECALRTRAYRKQIPFHLNGRRIIFTADDLREIAEGTPCRPELHDSSERPEQARVPTQRRKMTRVTQPESGGWRARRPRDAS